MEGWLGRYFSTALGSEVEFVWLTTADTESKR
jgi:hypothetical protein